MRAVFGCFFANNFGTVFGVVDFEECSVREAFEADVVPLELDLERSEVREPFEEGESLVLEEDLNFEEPDFLGHDLDLSHAGDPNVDDHVGSEGVVLGQSLANGA